MKILKLCDLFIEIPEEYLCELAISSKEIILNKGESIANNDLANSYIYIVAKGEINSLLDNKLQRTYKANNTILAIGEQNNNAITYLAKEDTQLIQIDVDDLDDLELITDDADIIKKIVFLLNEKL